MELIDIKRGRSNRELAEELRGIADRIEAGEVTGFIASYMADDGYNHMRNASPQDSLVMVTLLKRMIVNAF